MKNKVSIIIPVLNDAAALKLCLSAIKVCGNAELSETIVCDGGPDKECETLAAGHGARYIAAPRGRARQMNAGAAAAGGEWLWFLHADCIPHAESLSAIAALPAETKWGCFKHRLDDPRISLRVIELGDYLRASLCGLAYGDQGIFVRREVFEQIGGYPDVSLLEDVMLSQRLRKISRPRVLAPHLKTNARRWIERGVLRTTLTNWQIMWRYLVRGVSPEQLVGDYRSPPVASTANDK